MERVNTWFTHFSKLLVKTPEVEEPNETIPAVYKGLDIDDDPFTPVEFKKVITSLKLGQSAGPESHQKSISAVTLMTSVLAFVTRYLCNVTKHHHGLS